MQHLIDLDNMLKNGYSLAKIGIDTAENESKRVSLKERGYQWALQTRVFLKANHVRPAARAICPPLPGFISILWMMVPTGILFIGIAFPGFISTCEPEIT